jgi:hypothetical protein
LFLNKIFFICICVFCHFVVYLSYIDTNSVTVDAYLLYNAIKDFFMGATIAQVKVRRPQAAQATKTARQQTFQEWLADEAAVGRMVLASATGKPKLPAKPEGIVDFGSIYNEVRADRF